MLLPLPTYLAAARDIESLPVGEGTIINTGPLALRKVSTSLAQSRTHGQAPCVVATWATLQAHAMHAL
jgi:hypothetical protein